MKEIELKILEITPSKVISRLKKIGAKKIFEGRADAIYFDDSKKSLKRKGSVLRLRKKGTANELCVKRERGNKRVKIMDEFEVEVSDFAVAVKLLENLGYKQMCKIEKKRITYALGKTHFEIDKIKGIPPLLELECPSIKQMKKNLSQLGYSLEDGKPWSQFDVLRYYGK